MAKKVDTYDPTGNFGRDIDYAVKLDTRTGLFSAEVHGEEVEAETLYEVRSLIKEKYIERSVDELVPFWVLRSSGNIIHLEGWMLNATKDFGTQTGLTPDHAVVRDLTAAKHVPRKIQIYQRNKTHFIPCFLPQNGGEMQQRLISSMMDLQDDILYLIEVGRSALRRTAEMAPKQDLSTTVRDLEAIALSYSDMHKEMATQEREWEEKEKES